jgi:hypothetical protein
MRVQAVPLMRGPVARPMQGRGARVMHGLAERAIHDPEVDGIAQQFVDD